MVEYLRRASNQDVDDLVLSERAALERSAREGKEEGGGGEGEGKGKEEKKKRKEEKAESWNAGGSERLDDPSGLFNACHDA